MAVIKLPQNFLASCYQYEKKSIFFCHFWHEYVNLVLKEAKKSHLRVSSVTYLFEIPEVVAGN